MNSWNRNWSQVLRQFAVLQEFHLSVLFADVYLTEVPVLCFRKYELNFIDMILLLNF